MTVAKHVMSANQYQHLKSLIHKLKFINKSENTSTF